MASGYTQQDCVDALESSYQKELVVSVRACARLCGCAGEQLLEGAGGECVCAAPAPVPSLGCSVTEGEWCLHMEGPALPASCGSMARVLGIFGHLEEPDFVVAVCMAV